MIIDYARLSGLILLKKSACQGYYELDTVFLKIKKPILTCMNERGYVI